MTVERIAAVLIFVRVAAQCTEVPKQLMDALMSRIFESPNASPETVCLSVGFLYSTFSYVVLLYCV